MESHPTPLVARRPAWASETARALLIALAPLALDGCVSIGLSRSALERPADPGSLSVAIYDSPSDRSKNVPSPLPVYTELARKEGGGERTVARSMSATWAVEKLPPGDYVLRVKKRIDASGDIQEISGGREKSLAVRNGQRTSVQVILKRVPVVWIVVAAVTVVALVVLAIVLAQGGDVPLPHDLPLPPVEVALVAVDTSLQIAGELGRPRPAPAGVADVFPARGSVVAARRVTVNFLMSLPLDAGRIQPDAVSALGSVSGEIGGHVSYREPEQLLRFTPERDFSPGDEVTVTLDLSKVRTRDGAAGEGKVSTAFSVPR